MNTISAKSSQENACNSRYNKHNVEESVSQDGRVERVAITAIDKELFSAASFAENYHLEAPFDHFPLT